jgi:hypothetical protein
LGRVNFLTHALAYLHIERFQPALRRGRKLFSSAPLKSYSSYSLKAG